MCQWVTKYISLKESKERNKEPYSYCSTPTPTAAKEAFSRPLHSGLIDTLSKLCVNRIQTSARISELKHSSGDLSQLSLPGCCQPPVRGTVFRTWKNQDSEALNSPNWGFTKPTLYQGCPTSGPPAACGYEYGPTQNHKFA